jgi:hypothetical protein
MKMQEKETFRNGKKAPQGEDRKETDCQICGQTIIYEEVNWQADDNGVIFCPDCWDEKESCGCSD